MPTYVLQEPVYEERHSFCYGDWEARMICAPCHRWRGCVVELIPARIGYSRCPACGREAHLITAWYGYSWKELIVCPEPKE